MERGQVMELMRPRRERVREQLDVVMRDFVRRQPLMLVSVGGDGLMSRTGPPGFVRVVGDRGLDWAEPADAPLAATGGLSVLFVDFFHDRLALRIDGHAVILDHRARMRVESAFLRRI
jgi:hypothetical protein